MDRDYEVLGLAPGASPEEVKEAYRDLVKVWHPDRFSSDPQLQQKAQAKLKEINAAYARLRAGLGDLGTGRSPRSRPESPPPEQPLHTPSRPPSQEEASQASQEEVKARKWRAGSWWRMRAWQFARFLGDLSEGGWWLSGGRWSYWKMWKLTWVVILCALMGACAVMVVRSVVGEEGIRVGVWIILGVLLVIIVHSWVAWLRKGEK